MRLLSEVHARTVTPARQRAPTSAVRDDRLRGSGSLRSPRRRTRQSFTWHGIGASAKVPGGSGNSLAPGSSCSHRDIDQRSYKIVPVGTPFCREIRLLPAPSPQRLQKCAPRRAPQGA